MIKKLFPLILIPTLCFVTVFAQTDEAWLWPVSGFHNLSSGFGQRSFGNHKGIDIAGPEAGIIENALILASRSGTVIETGEDCTHNYAKTKSCGCGGGYGNYVYVRLADATVTRYGHMTKVLVKEGQAVTQGDALGTVGSTGNSGGHHLHFEIRDTEDTPQNPMPMNEDEKHTYEGSSAPHSESIPYVYTASSTQTEVRKDGTIKTTIQTDDTDIFVLFYDYKDGNLLHFEAKPYEKQIIRKPTRESDTVSIRILQSDGSRYDTERVSLVQPSSSSISM